MSRKVNEARIGLMKTIAEIGLDPARERVISKTSQLLRKSFPVARVILFGSVAKGTSDLESDIDLLVLTDIELSWRERGRLVDSLFDIELEFDVVISPLIVSVEQWSSGPWLFAPIRREIDQYGAAA